MLYLSLVALITTSMSGPLPSVERVFLCAWISTDPVCPTPVVLSPPFWDYESESKPWNMHFHIVIDSNAIDLRIYGTLLQGEILSLLN
jgi:hypothetical protein